jgi:hypothetical protein
MFNVKLVSVHVILVTNAWILPVKNFVPRWLRVLWMYSDEVPSFRFNISTARDGGGQHSPTALVLHLHQRESFTTKAHSYLHAAVKLVEVVHHLEDSFYVYLSNVYDASFD